jgi:MFS family permease
MAWQMGLLAQSWLVYALTGSALSLGWVRTSWSVGSLSFALMGGIIADRTEKKRLMVLGHAGLGLMPLVVALFALVGRVSVWMLALNAMSLGVFFSLLNPARESYTAELVGRRALLNAMALSRMGMASMGILSSLVGGAVMEQLGATVAFLSVGVLYAGTVGLILPLPRSSSHQRVPLSVGREFLAGLRYVVSHRVVMAVLGLELVRVLLVLPYQTFLPVFAAEVFQLGAFGLGVMSAVLGVGGLVGALVVASLGDYPRKGLLLLISGAASALALLLFAQMSHFYAALALLFVLGMANDAYMVIRSALLQTTASPEMRGRMVGFWRIVWGMSPLGILPAGALADRWGAPLTVSVEALVSLVMLAVLWVTLPILRQEESEAGQRGQDPPKQG